MIKSTVKVRMRAAFATYFLGTYQVLECHLIETLQVREVLVYFMWYDKEKVKVPNRREKKC